MFWYGCALLFFLVATLKLALGRQRRWVAFGQSGASDILPVALIFL